MGKHLNSVKVECEQFLEIICKKTGGWQVRGFSAPGEVFPVPTYPVPPRFEIYWVPLQVLGQLPPLLGTFPRSVSCATRMLVAFSIKPQGSHPQLPRGSHFKHTTLCIVLRRAETMLHFLEQQLPVHHQPREFAYWQAQGRAPMMNSKAGRGQQLLALRQGFLQRADLHLWVRFLPYCLVKSDLTQWLL